MGFGWKPRVEGLTWESLSLGDVLVSQRMLDAYLILDRIEGNHRAVSLIDATRTRIRADDAFIGVEDWEVFRASR